MVLYVWEKHAMADSACSAVAVSNACLRCEYGECCAMLKWMCSVRHVSVWCDNIELGFFTWLSAWMASKWHLKWNSYSSHDQVAVVWHNINQQNKIVWLRNFALVFRLKHNTHICVRVSCFVCDVWCSGTDRREREQKKTTFAAINGIESLHNTVLKLFGTSVLGERRMMSRRWKWHGRKNGEYF